MGRIFPGILALALLTIPSAFAQQTDKNLFIGPQIGLFSEKLDGGDFSSTIGAAIRYKFSPEFGLQGSINYRHEEFGEQDSLTVRSWPVLATAMFYPVDAVYGLVGMGLYNTSFDRNDSGTDLADNTKSDIGWHFGGGVEFPLGSQSLLTGDVRYVFLNQNLDGPSGLGNEGSDFYMVTVGILVGL